MSARTSEKTFEHADREKSGNEYSLLKIENLKTYFYTDDGIVRAVDGVSLEIGREQTLGVVGESGCGKSIMAFSVMRLIPTPPGKIVDGEILFYRKNKKNPVDLADLNPKGAKIRSIRGNEIAMIFQEPMTSLSPVHTIGNQISEAIKLHQKVNRREAWERTVEALRKVQLPQADRQATSYPHELSGGMRQRVMIAMALSCNPSLLIADEPTTALDVTVQAQILDLMRSLQQEIGMSIMLITHDLGVVARMSDFVAVMYLGKVVEYADTRTILKTPQHPYTVGLIDSIPRIGRKTRLVPIKGSVPDPLEKIVGCSFYARCPHAMPQCREEPPLVQVGQGHAVKCWLAAGK